MKIRIQIHPWKRGFQADFRFGSSSKRLCQRAFWEVVWRHNITFVCPLPGCEKIFRSEKIRFFLLRKMLLGIFPWKESCEQAFLASRFLGNRSSLPGSPVLELLELEMCPVTSCPMGEFLSNKKREDSLFRSLLQSATVIFLVCIHTYIHTHTHIDRGPILHALSVSSMTKTTSSMFVFVWTSSMFLFVCARAHAYVCMCMQNSTPGQHTSKRFPTRQCPTRIHRRRESSTLPERVPEPCTCAKTRWEWSRHHDDCLCTDRWCT